MNTNAAVTPAPTTTPATPAPPPSDPWDAHDPEDQWVEFQSGGITKGYLPHTLVEVDLNIAMDRLRLFYPTRVIEIFGHRVEQLHEELNRRQATSVRADGEGIRSVAFRSWADVQADEQGAAFVADILAAAEVPEEEPVAP